MMEKMNPTTHFLRFGDRKFLWEKEKKWILIWSCDEQEDEKEEDEEEHLQFGASDLVGLF